MLAFNFPSSRTVCPATPVSYLIKYVKPIDFIHMAVSQPWDFKTQATMHRKGQDLLSRRALYQSLEFPFRGQKFPIEGEYGVS